MQKVDPVKNNKYLCSVDYKAPPTNEKEIDGGDTEDDYSDENEESENEKSEIDMFEADVVSSVTYNFLTILYNIEKWLEATHTMIAKIQITWVEIWAFSLGIR